jgi:hypothetical protein
VAEATQYFSVRGGATPDPDWFESDDPGPGMVELARGIAQGQSWRRTLNLRLARLYQDRQIASVYAQQGGPGSLIDDVLAPQRVSWNIVRSACDIAHARVGRNRGRVMFVSVDGNWSLRRKARLRTRFIDGAFRQADVYEEGRRVFLDALVFGLGLLHIYSQDGRLCSERVLPDEVIVDPGEGLHARPRTMYRRKPMLRREALRRYAGDDETKIKAVKGAPLSSTVIGQERSVASADVIDVFEAWRLPDGKDDQGRHVIAVEGCTLTADTWDRPRFPIVAFRWGDALAGYYGLGVAEQLVGTQLEIRRTLHNIQTALYHGSTFKTYVPVGCKITAKVFNNDPRGAVAYYSGNVAPQQVAPAAVNPELPQFLDRLWQQGFDQVGLPPSGSGAVPTNIKSGEGIRAYTEAIDSRLAVPNQRWDQFSVDVAEVMLDEVRDLGNVAVESKVRRSYQRINWKDVAGGDDEFVLQAWPASILPATPSGKYDRLNEMVQSQWISKEQAMSVLDVPDLEHVIGLETSTYELIGMHLESMLDEGHAEQPEPYQGLDLSLRIVQDAYLKARTDKAPDDRLALCRDYIDAIRDLQKAAKAEAAPPMPPAPPPGAPGAEAMPPGPPMGPPPEMMQPPPMAMAA